MKPFVQRIVVVTRERWVPMVSELNHEITIVIREPSTMSDAVRLVTDKFFDKNYLVGMPDTYFSGENPYAKLNDLAQDIEVGLACWKISDELKGRVGQVDFNNSTGVVYGMEDKKSNCPFDYMWGAMRISYETMKKIVIDNPHPGIDVANMMNSKGIKPKATLVQGRYFDVGTLSGYRELLNVQK
jgi:hypothetical protein